MRSIRRANRLFADKNRLSADFVSRLLFFAIHLQQKCTMNHSFDITSLLSSFAPVSLEEMSGIRLMNRMDTKYVVSLPTLIRVLERAIGHYRIQEIEGERNMAYRTVYLDTPDYAMYLAHQNGRPVREKIRVRTYLSSGLTFLEVKNKNNKGRTDKKRISVGGTGTLYADGGEEFLRKHAWYELSALNFLLENHFHRITLVNHAMSERLTIDTGVHFHHLLTGAEAGLENLAIIELKRDGKATSSIGGILHDLHVRPAGISKYCVGTVMTAGKLKYNRFKPKLRLAWKIAGEKD